jgi:nicotinamidase-related amidase
MLTLSDHTALILIDVQNGFDDPRMGGRNNPQAESNIAALLAAWRESGRPLIHVKHNSLLPGSPLRPGQAGNEIKSQATPQADEPVIGKTVNSAFIGTDLEDRLRESGIDSVVLVGLTTDHCVSTTARMAGNLGFETLLVADATAAFDRAGPDGTLHPAETVYRVELAILHGEFATVVSTADVLAALAR